MSMMIYFDSASTSCPKPDVVIEAVADAMRRFGNPSRGTYDASLEASRCLTRARMELADYLGVRDSERVVFTQNATDALNLAISGVSGHIVTTAAEHNSVLRPVYRHGSYTIVPVDAMGRLQVDDVDAAIRPDTGAVVMTLASNTTGNVYDIGAAGALCRERGVRFIVDGAQGVGLLPVHVDRDGIDALCFSGHKSLFGPQGTGGMCMSRDFLPPSRAVGGSGGDSFSHAHPAHLPDALEAGTQNAHGVAGLLAGLQYVKSQAGNCFTAADKLTRLFVDKVRGIDGVSLYGDIDAPVRMPVVSLTLRDISCADAAFSLQERYGIAVRAGAHCAPLMHHALGTGQSGMLRFSFSHQNTVDEVGQAVSAIKELLKEK